MSDVWFCKIGDKKVGPLSVQQLKVIVARGQLRPEHMIRRGSEGPWVPAGRVKGLFPEKPGGTPPKSVQAKPVAQPLDASPAPGRPVARAVNLPTAQVAPQPPASELPPEMAMGPGHKHHVVMDVDKLDIDAEPVMVSTRKPKNVTGLKKDEQRKLMMILGGVIGGGLVVAVIVILVAFLKGNLSPPSPPPKEEVKLDQPEAATKPAEHDEKVAPKDSASWTIFPGIIRRGKGQKVIEVKLEPLVCGAPPAGCTVDASEHPRVLVIPVTLRVKMGGKEEIQYAGWSESARENISLKDDAKTTYELLELIEAKGAKVIGPGSPVKVRLIFVPPSKKVNYLRLELPASAFGEQGMLKFQIPSERIVVTNDAGGKKTAQDEPDAAAAKSKQAKARPAAVSPPPVRTPTTKKATTKKAPAADPDAGDEVMSSHKPKAAEGAADDDPASLIKPPPYAK